MPINFGGDPIDSPEGRRLPDIERFMRALAQFESGGNYYAVGPQTETLGRALGAYQIMSGNWNWWATEAGIRGADWRDPAAQDHVARFKMQQYYDTYGSWDLVAIAWFAGPGAANKAQRAGLSSVGNRSDVLGTTVTQYVNAVMGNFGSPNDPPPLVFDPYVTEYDPNMEQPEMPDEAPITGRKSPKKLTTQLIEALSAKAAGGQRRSLPTLGGLPEMEGLPEIDTEEVADAT